MRSLIKYLFLFIFAVQTFNLSAWNTPVISSPSNGAIVWTGVTVDWNAVTNSEYYQIQIDTSLSFSSPVLIQSINAYINSSSGNADTKFDASDLLFGKTYYWRVRAYVTGDTSAWAQSTFTTRDYVTLTSPANGSSNWTGLTLDWEAHTSVDFYDIEIDTTLNFNSPLLIQATNAYINSSSSNSDTKYDASDLHFGKTYYWRVRARNAADTSIWTIRNFITRDYVSLTSPVNGSSNWTGLTLDWEAHTSVDFYDIEIDTTLNFNSPLLIQATNAYINSSSGNSDTKYDASDLHFGKTYYWRVRARNAVGTSAWSYRNFTTRDYVTLTSPANGASNWTGLTLDWEAHTSVDFYDIEIDTTLSFNSPVLIQATNAYINSSSSNSDTKYDVSGLYFGKTYFWRVRVRNAVGTSAWSYRNFTTRDYVTLTSPANGQLNVSISGTTLDWDAHQGILIYQFQFDTVPSFNSSFLINQNIAYINASNNNNDTRYITGALLVNKLYYWRVKAINTVDTSLWSIRYFSTGDCQVPGLISGNSSVCESTPNSYNINPVAGATSYNWTLPSGWSGNSITNSITVIPASNGGLIKVSVNNACGISPEQLLYVSVDPLPDAAGTISGNTTVCQGQNSVTYSVATITNATSYIWTLPDGANGTSTTNSVSVNFGTYATSGNITVKGSNSCGDGAVSTLPITVNELPAAAGTISGNTTVCQGQNSVTYSIATITNATSYIWTLPGGASGTSTTNSITVNFGTSATSGNITVKGSNSCGDGAVSTLAITVNEKPITPIITLNGLVLHSNAQTGNQWYNQNGLINGATNQNYTVTANGDYYVIVTLTACSSDPSNTINVIITGMEVVESYEDIKVYPNPVFNELVIKKEGNNNKVNFEIINATGQVVFKGILVEKTTVPTSNFASGVYLIKLENGKTFEFKKIIKE